MATIYVSRKGIGLMLIKHTNETSDENERSHVSIQKSKPFFFQTLNP